jgi:2-dehydro-3-deoxy-D-arabinonate dehydratase
MDDRALYRVALPGGPRLALGPPSAGPERLLPPEMTLDELLSGSANRFWGDLEQAPTSALTVPAQIIAPIETQEVWAAGVTYAPSRDARKLESPRYGSIYGAVFSAERPELFYKSAGPRVRGPGEAIAIRSDSSWNVPEPELVLVTTSRCDVVAVTVGNDVSSRSIEGANPLYLPQAKIYDGACALGPCLVRPPQAITLEINLEIRRGAEMIFRATTNTSQIVRPLAVLARWLGRALTFPVGAFLFTGTGIIPPPEFSLHEGDDVVITIEGIGKLANRVGRIECGDPPTDEAAHFDVREQ